MSYEKIQNQVLILIISMLMTIAKKQIIKNNKNLNIEKKNFV